MFEHAAEHRALFAAMMGRKGGYLVQELFQDMWTEMLRVYWPEATELGVHAISGALMATIVWWLTNAPQLTADQVESDFRRLVEPLFLGSSLSRL